MKIFFIDLFYSTKKYKRVSRSSKFWKNNYSTVDRVEGKNVLDHNVFPTRVPVNSSGKFTRPNNLKCRIWVCVCVYMWGTPLAFRSSSSREKFTPSQYTFNMFADRISLKSFSPYEYSTRLNRVVDWILKVKFLSIKHIAWFSKTNSSPFQ